MRGPSLALLLLLSACATGDDTTGADLATARLDLVAGPVEDLTTMEQEDAAMPGPDLACATPCASGCCKEGEGCCSDQCTKIDTTRHCGKCGNMCPGAGYSTSEAACTAGMCSMTCKGENFDVNNDPADGCEKKDLATPPGHTQMTAKGLGSQKCWDSTQGMFTSKMLADARIHANPAIEGFDTMMGNAPHWWKVTHNKGSFIDVCQKNFAATLATKGGGTKPCYKLSIITDKQTKSVVATGTDSQSVTSDGSDAYAENGEIYFKVEKVCPLPLAEDVTYEVTFNL